MGSPRKDGTPAQPCPHGRYARFNRRAECILCKKNAAQNRHNAAKRALRDKDRQSPRPDRNKCPHGPDTERYGSNYACKTCATISAAVWQKAHRHTYTSRFHRAIAASIRRKKQWTLSFEQYVSAVSAPCCYCKNMLGLPVVSSTGLDRLDNALGYVPGNVVACCETCNKLRGDYLSPEETRVLVQTLLKYRALGHV